jgi:hypothetical protein
VDAARIRKLVHMGQPSTGLPRRADSIFAIPCLRCGTELVAVEEFEFRCPECGALYLYDLGYLLPLDHPLNPSS